MMTTEYLTTILANEFHRERLAEADGHRNRRLARRRRHSTRQRPNATCL